MRLVVCVDRDDDFGRKAGVAGPIVGRDQVLDAAMRLGMADPEDSDTNAVFAAIGVLDDLRKDGEEAEVVVLTGAAQVGLVSDRRVAEQFDRVLAEHSAKSAFLVSDGAEDEYLYPILASRVRIDGVRRVYIRQSASLESTYYTMVRALKDPKLRAKTILPLALVLLTLGLAAASGVVGWGVIGIVVLLGVYLVFWTFDIDEAIIDSVRSASTDIRQGSAAFGFGLFSLALVGVGFLSGYNIYVSIPLHTPLDRVLLFMQAALVYWVFAAFVWECGRAIRRYFYRGRFPRSFFVATVSIAGIGLLSYGIVFTVEFLEVLVAPATLPLVVSTLVAGLALIIGAGVLQQYLRSRTGTEDRSSASASQTGHV
ncbi:MAG TPA: DUF373 family protein [Thermoplasmata archaeon]|nr:DUF373 family protein [Thermoplasmata archaeon]